MNTEDRKEVVELIEKAIEAENQKLQIHLRNIDSKLGNICEMTRDMGDKLNNVEKEQLLRAQSCPFRQTIENTTREVDRNKAIKGFIYKALAVTSAVWSAIVIAIIKIFVR